MRGVSRHEFWRAWATPVFAIIFAAMLAVASIALSPEKAYADARTSDVPSYCSGSAYIENAWMDGWQSYFNVSGFNGVLSSQNWHSTFECQNHTAAEPEWVWGSYEAWFNNCSYDGGWVEYWCVITPPDATDGYSRNQYGLIGYQRVGGYIRIPWSFNKSLDVNWRLEGPTGSITDTDGETDYGICSVKVGGTVQGTDVKDYCASHKRGSSYEIYNIKSNKIGYVYRGVAAGSVSGTLNNDASVRLKYGPIKYAVAYNANGGTGSMANTNHTYDLAANLRANAFTRKNTATFDSAGGSNKPASQTPSWTWNGWNTNASGTGTNYSNQQSVKNLTATDNATVTLYAKWTAPQITLPSAGSRTNWVFKGWYVGNTRVGGAGDKVTLSANTTYTAHWNPQVHYVIDGDANYLKTVDEVTNGAAWSVPAARVTSGTRPNCTLASGASGFDGWYTDAAYTKKWVNGTKVSAPLTLYARNKATLRYAHGPASNPSVMYKTSPTGDDYNTINNVPITNLSVLAPTAEYWYGTRVTLPVLKTENGSAVAVRLFYDVVDQQFPLTLREVIGWCTDAQCATTPITSVTVTNNLQLYKPWTTSNRDGVSNNK